MLSFATAAAVSLASPAVADIPARLACIADDVLFIWYREALASGLPAIPVPPDPNQRIVAARATQPETRMRFSEGKLFISDSHRSEYYYGDLTDEGGGRYRSSHLTLMFDEPYRTLVVVSVDQLSSVVTSFKCVAG